MTPIKKFCSIPSIKKTIAKSALAIMVAGTISLSSCSSGGQEYVSETKVELTQGLVTTVEEVEKDLFKIADETVVDKKEDARIIAQYLDGKIDTFTLDEAKLIDASTPGGSSMRGALLGGVMGYYMGRSLSSPINSSSYKNQSAYQKSQTKTASTLKSTASRTTVRKPVNSSKGYGSGRSTRSYGG